jgi:hypothetical protein
MCIPTIQPALPVGAALRGMRTAATRMEQAAQRISGAATLPSSRDVTAAFSAQQAASGLPGAALDLLMARRAYEANVVVLRSAEEMAADLLRLRA